MDFIIRLFLFINEKSNSYNFIFIIINELTKIIYYKLMQIIIYIFRIANLL